MSKNVFVQHKREQDEMNTQRQVRVIAIPAPHNMPPAPENMGPFQPPPPPQHQDQNEVITLFRRCLHSPI